MKTDIVDVIAWEALDSRGNPTVACEIRLEGGASGEAIVPSGASTGTHEAAELRDGGDRFGGKGTSAAVKHVMGELRAAVHGLNAADQLAIDRALRDCDGSDRLERLGANAVLAVSVASAIAAARGADVPLYAMVLDASEQPLLPMPMVNVISGGAHAGRSIDVQDFLVIPTGASRFAEAIEWAWRVRRSTAEVLENRGLPVALVADEGGLGPPLPSNRSALEVLAEGIERSGLRLGEDAVIAIDVAATQFFESNGTYRLQAEQRTVSSRELVEELVAWCDDFPVASIEDALAEDDWEGWVDATAALGPRTQLLGDDLFVTNRARLDRGTGSGVANAVLVKPNQIGTLSDARDVVVAAHAASYATVLSARSGETEDSWLADLAVGWRTGQIKVGSTMRSERTAKWNRLLRIEAELGASAVFAPPSVIASWST